MEDSIMEGNTMENIRMHYKILSKFYISGCLCVCEGIQFKTYFLLFTIVKKISKACLQLE